jgi:transcription termination/antitermination protein NusA
MDENEEGVVTLFMNALDLNRSVAVALFDDGFDSLEAIAYVPVEELERALILESVDIRSIQEKARDVLLARVMSCGR